MLSQKMLEIKAVLLLAFNRNQNLLFWQTRVLLIFTFRSVYIYVVSCVTPTPV